MAIRVYIVPVIGDGLSVTTAKRAKYISGGGIAGRYLSMNYGNEPTMLVVADVTPTEHTAIVANADIVAAPADLDMTIGANLSVVQTRLEAVNIPADWITAGMTYRAVLRWIRRLFLLLQRTHGRYPVRWLLGVTLESQVGDLSATARQRLQEAAASMGLSTAGITLAMTIRAALKDLVAQLPDQGDFKGAL